MRARKSVARFGTVFIFLPLIYCVSSLTTTGSLPKQDTVVLLAKTKETFKLADLQFLEATVQSEDKYDCKRFLLDAATGSSLFLLDQLAADFKAYIFGKETRNYRGSLPSSLHSCEWVGEVLCMSSSPEELLDELSTKATTHHLETWTLEYVRMTSRSMISSRDVYTQKTLCCCISQKLSGKAALYPSHAVDKLLIVDTSESVFLVKLLQLPSDAVSSIPCNSALLTQPKWAQRPFPYSSATNFQAAEMAINLLVHRVALRSSDPTTKPHLLDATCGSGTFLALAMARGMQVTGWDSNARCVEGTERNLQYAFGSMESCTVLHRNCLNVPKNRTKAGVEKIDAVACNLPWGLNSNLFVGEGNSESCSSHLLSAIRKILQPGVPCVFFYKDDDDTAQGDLYWEQLGYNVIGHASIPQKNFVLPKEGKKEKKRSEESGLTGRSSCIVSLVETI